MLAVGSTFGVCTSNRCNTLLRELQQIWCDIGESEADKDRMLLNLERECLEVYRRKVDEAANTKARLHQSVATKEAELATLMAALGELNIQPMTKNATTLKDQLMLLAPVVEDLKLKKEERMKQFLDMRAQIDKITVEISGYSHLANSGLGLDMEEQDLSLRKLNEYQTCLQALQKEKSDRLQKIMEHVNELHILCGVLNLDFTKTVRDVHPSLHTTSLEQSKNISDCTLEGLEHAILKLKTERKVRFKKLKDIVAAIRELWNLMDPTKEDKHNFTRIISISSEAEIVEPGSLSMDTIQQASEEVEKLTKFKASRMKELVMQKRSELEDICRKTHIEADSNTAADKSNVMIDSGLVDPCELLKNIEGQINKAKDEALGRKYIIDRIDRWLSACEEENWLEEYNLDHSRYNAGRGAHINLKRAERARITVTKIPAIVDSLITKTLAWESERRKQFLYNGVRLVSILNDYKLTRQQKEEAKKQYKDQKKLRDLLLIEKESMYGSKPSPRRSSSFRNANGYHANGNGSMTPAPRRNSVGCATPELQTPRSYSGRHNGQFKEMRRLSTGRLNFLALGKEDIISLSSVCGSDPESPPLA
ncbi:65-kDa microtubule-associated protein 6-like [Heracleum sosnowskyi]|uniref:65-kDa microtubule-associated protein 6-like n=1 Tax=Heracleum sosnowskyi TaxID=360622 RepID=A0AAD8MW22_9APIA|nr:65-kDa microtubule-associated protein 6-like [Heracleum sosnowskyi]